MHARQGWHRPRLGARLAALFAALVAGCTAQAESGQPQSGPAVSGRASAADSAAEARNALASPRSSARPRARAVRLAFVGDITLASSLGQLLARRAYDMPLAAPLAADHPFGAVAAKLRGADLLVGNLECVVSPLGASAIEGLPLRCPLPVLDALADVGFDVLSVANNHALDFGRDAFDDTLRRIEASGLAHLGSEAMATQPQPPHIVRIEGVTVGLLGYYHPPLPPFEDVRRARARVDVLVIYNHWGREDQSEPMPQQRALAHALVDAGADLVVGTHAHVLQPLERRGDSLIAYGLGNFVFDAMPLTEARRRGAILEVEVDERGLRGHRLVTTRMGADRSLSLLDEPAWQRRHGEPDRSGSGMATTPK